jgi:hypothetical protein
VEAPEALASSTSGVIGEGFLAVNTPHERKMTFLSRGSLSMCITRRNPMSFRGFPRQRLGPGCGCRRRRPVLLVRRESRTDQDLPALASSLGPRHSAAEPPHRLRRPTDAGVGSAAGDVLLTPSSGPESGELATCGVLNQ